MKIIAQKTFSRLWNGYETDSEAKAARDAAYRAARVDGYKAHRWTLKNQEKQYSDLGKPDGRSCDVFMLDVYEKQEKLI